MESLVCFHVLPAAWYAKPFNYLTANFSLVTGYILQLYSVCLKGNPLEYNKVYAKKLCP